MNMGTQGQTSLPAAPSFVGLGREVCGDVNAAGEREWLVTNGIGGFAAGAGARY